MAKFEKLQRLNVEVSNADETARKYAITADAQVANGKVENLNNGQVKEGETFIASFNRWSGNNMNVSFNNVADDKQCEVLNEINAFVASVDALVDAQPINI